MKKTDWWDFFDEDLYCDYLIKKDEQMYTYKITYKYYKGSTDEAEMCIAIKYVQADDKGEAMRLFGMWEKLILKIERV